MTLPTAFLLSGTVALVSAVTTFAATATDAKQDEQPAVVENGAITKPKVNLAPTPVVPKQDSTINARKGFLFSFSDKPETPKDYVADPKPAIEKARALHLAAIELFKDKKIEEAKDKEKEAIAAAPHFWLPHAGLTYMYSEQRKPFEALQEAQESVYGEHGPVADRNAGRLFEQIHWFAPAALEFQKAIKAEPSSWQSRIGLTDCYIIQAQYPEAAQALDAIPPEALSQFEPVSEVALRYMQVGQYKKAQDDFVKALDLATSDGAKETITDLLFTTAVQTGDKDLLAKLQDKISNTLRTGKLDVILQAKIELAPTAADVDGVLKEAAAFQGNQADQLFYVLGLKLVKRADEATDVQKTEWLKKADVAFQNAVSRNTTALTYRLAVASVAEQLGNTDTVLRTLAGIKDSVPGGSDDVKFGEISGSELKQKLADFQKSNLVAAFPTIKRSTTGGAETAAYESSARDMKLRLSKPSCSCHARSIASAMAQLPGVIYTSYTHEAKPALSIVYDSHKTTVKKLMDAKFMQQLKEPVDQEGDVAVPTIAQLSSLVFAMDRQQQLPQNRPARPALELPTETGGELAETGTQPAVH